MMSLAHNALPPEGELVSACLMGAGEDQLDAVLDAWLADEFDGADYRHVYGWEDDAEELS